MHLGKSNSFSFLNQIRFYFSWEIYRLNNKRIKQQHIGEIFGFTSLIMRFPNDNACIIVLSNLEGISMEEISEHLTDILFEEND
jgi:hypothetical protein